MKRFTPTSGTFCEEAGTLVEAEQTSNTRRDLAVAYTYDKDSRETLGDGRVFVASCALNEDDSATGGLFGSALSFLPWASSAQTRRNSTGGAFGQCLAFHHSLPLLAVSSHNNAVMFVSTKSSSVPPASLPPTLISPQLQHDIACGTFHPTHPLTLAVGVKGGVCLWFMSSFSTSMLLSSFSAPRLHFLRLPSATTATHVTTLSFSPRGDKLVCGGTGGAEITVFDTASGECVSLTSPALKGGVSHVMWDPTDTHVCAGASHNNAFVVWDTQSWGFRVWTHMPSPPSSLCWSADGRVLLVSTLNDPSVFWLRFTPNTKSAGHTAHVIGTFSLPHKIGLYSEGQSSAEWGIDKMIWESDSQRLVVTAAKKSDRAERLVSIFQTSPDPALDLKVRPVGTVQAPIAGAIALEASLAATKAGCVVGVAWADPLCVSTIPILATRFS